MPLILVELNELKFYHIASDGNKAHMNRVAGKWIKTSYWLLLQTVAKRRGCTHLSAPLTVKPSADAR